jgi:lysophospholipase II
MNTQQLAVQLPYVKFVLPTAPTRRVTLNMGMSMPAWYDIIGIDERSNESCEGIDESVQTIQSILHNEHETYGLSYDRMCLAGFSQGGALSVYTGLQLPQAIAGVICLSGYVPHASAFTVQHPSVPVFHGHGTQDMVVPYRLAERSREAILSKGLQQYTLKSYPMAHTASPTEINDALKFLQQILPPNDTCRIQLPDPTQMSIKELKAEIQAAGLSHKVIGLVEKSEFIALVQKHRDGK